MRRRLGPLERVEDTLEALPGLRGKWLPQSLLDLLPSASAGADELRAGLLAHVEVVVIQIAEEGGKPLRGEWLLQLLHLLQHPINPAPVTALGEGRVGEDIRPVVVRPQQVGQLALGILVP